MANTIFLRLEGPLQSWGERARWSVRDTASEPTKSGIVGLLACSLGLHDDSDLRSLSREIRLGIRCDRPGVRIVDYHTVVGGVLSAEGKVKITQATGKVETVVSWRHYLADASFLAAIQADPALIARLAAAVQEPTWVVFLGRKCCVPARPLFEGFGDFSGLEQALKAWPLNGHPAGQEVTVRAVIDSAPGRGMARSHELQSNTRRTFGPRHVEEIGIKLSYSEVV